MQIKFQTSKRTLNKQNELQKELIKFVLIDHLVKIEFCIWKKTLGEPGWPL